MDWTLRVVSPMFLTGAIKTQPEFRAPSVRGQLRYWLRAIKGAETDRLSEIWAAESAVFGSTQHGQGVTMRLFGVPKTGRVLMLPHRDEERRRAPAPAILANQKAILQLITRPGVPIPERALHALRLWSLIGGVGKRSRRMFGAVDLKPREGTDWFATSNSPDELAQAIVEALRAAIPAPNMRLYTGSLPNFPTLHPAHSWVIVARQPFDDPEEANIDLFRNLLRTNRFRAKEQTFGQAMGGRRASPLIAQVRQIGDQYYPVLTALRSMPDSRGKIDWAHLKAFMEAATAHYNAEKVWGGW